MWHCVVLVITKGKGSFSFLFVEQIDVKHTCCASETLFQHFDPVPIDPVFSHTSIHQRDRQTAVAATVDRAVLDIPSQFRTEASQATDPVIYTLDSCAPLSRYALTPNILSERRFEVKIGCMGAG